MEQTSAANPSKHVDCPDCGSSDTRRLSLIFKEGTAVFTAETSPKWFSGRSQHVSSNTTGLSRSQLTSEAAAPEKAPTMRTLLIGGLVTAFMSDFGRTWSIAAGLLTMIVVWRCVRYNSSEFPRLFATWKNSFLCRRCGRVFDPSTF